MVTPAAKREAVAHLRGSLEVSERRACSIIAADRSVVRYLSQRPDDSALRARLRELADQRRRFGYRREETSRAPRSMAMSVECLSWAEAAKASMTAVSA